MNNLFFLTLAILSIASVMVSTNAYAEIGQNFDRTQIAPNKFQWSSHYDRIFDSGQWVNYKWNDNGNIITFESANIIYKLDKNLCTFQLLNPDTKAVSLDLFNHTLTVGGTPKVLSACNITSTAPNSDGLQIKITRNSVDAQLVTIYDLGAGGVVEWTHEITNTNLLVVSSFGIQDTCDNCVPQKTVGDMINFGDYTLDTKNIIHNTLKTSQADKGDYIMTYEGGIMVAGQKLIIDPTVSFTAQIDSYITDDNNDGICSVGSLTDNTAATQLTAGMQNSVSTVDCFRAYLRFNTTSIPDTSVVTNSSFQFEVESVSTPENGDIKPFIADPSTQSLNDKFLDAGNGTSYVANSAVFTTVGNFKDLDLGTQADTDIQSRLVANWFAIGIRGTDETQSGVDEIFQLSSTESASGPTPVPTLTVTYTPPLPDAVTDLINTTTRDTSVALDWTEPDLKTGILQGYRINFTTPYGNPLTIINNNSGTASNVNVTGLTKSTPYSFRVAAWTEAGNNASGNILNVTTTEFTPVNFTLGFLDVAVTNPDIFPIRFARTDINATSLFLNVTYSNTYNLTCSFYYKFAMTNATYSNLPNVTVSGTEIRSDFTFVNASNEVIDVFCKNENSPNNGTYILTQTSFPLLAQFRNFTGGVYGTTGQFGTVNLVTLGIIIASMIGFNRINPSVGAIFTIIIIFGAGYFGFITIPEQMIAAFILVAVLAFMTTRKDD